MDANDVFFGVTEDNTTKRTDGRKSVVLQGAVRRASNHCFNDIFLIFVVVLFFFFLPFRLAAFFFFFFLFARRARRCRREASLRAMAGERLAVGFRVLVLFFFFDFFVVVVVVVGGG
ncbi:uncharacterized protein J3D65DRAFT_194208 [Phyllosticta citribraziliensis]|uniref:Transmembrane protein n=1 Tax=Phyllosticta citribraziliensis TaxID=989973 RepID=A0ABR1M4X2_9PEZI